MENENICWICGCTMPKEVAEKLGNPIKDLGLLPRTREMLYRNGIETIEQLTQLSYFELKCLRGMGDISVNEIKEKLRIFGFRPWHRH